MKKLLVILSLGALSACTTLTPEQAKSNIAAADDFTVCRATIVDLALNQVRYPAIVIAEKDKRNLDCSQYKEVFDQLIISHRAQQEREHANYLQQQRYWQQYQANQQSFQNQQFDDAQTLYQRNRSVQTNCTRTYNGYQCQSR